MLTTTQLIKLQKYGSEKKPSFPHSLQGRQKSTTSSKRQTSKCPAALWGVTISMEVTKEDLGGGCRCPFHCPKLHPYRGRPTRPRDPAAIPCFASTCWRGSQLPRRAEAGPVPICVWEWSSPGRQMGQQGTRGRRQGIPGLMDTSLASGVWSCVFWLSLNQGG